MAQRRHVADCGRIAGDACVIVIMDKAEKLFDRHYASSPICMANTIFLHHLYKTRINIAYYKTSIPAQKSRSAANLTLNEHNFTIKDKCLYGLRLARYFQKRSVVRADPRQPFYLAARPGDRAAPVALGGGRPYRGPDPRAAPAGTRLCAARQTPRHVHRCGQSGPQAAHAGAAANGHIESGARRGSPWRRGPQHRRKPG